MDVKKCSRCKNEKEFSEFNVRTDTQKYRKQCRGCIKLIKKEYQTNIKDKVNLYNNSYFQHNKDKINNYRKKYEKMRRENDVSFRLIKKTRCRL